MHAGLITVRDTMPFIWYIGLLATTVANLY